MDRNAASNPQATNRNGVRNMRAKSKRCDRKNAATNKPPAAKRVPNRYIVPSSAPSVASLNPKTNSYTPSTATSRQGKRTVPHVEAGLSSRGIDEKATLRQPTDARGSSASTTAARAPSASWNSHPRRSPKKKLPLTYRTMRSVFKQLSSSAQSKMCTAVPTPPSTSPATSSAREPQPAPWQRADAIMRNVAPTTTGRRSHSGARRRASSTPARKTTTIVRLRMSWPFHALSPKTWAARKKERSLNALTKAKPNNGIDR